MPAAVSSLNASRTREVFATEPIEPSYRILVYVRDTTEKPYVLRTKFPNMPAAIAFAWELAQRLQGTTGWLVPRDFEENPLYARFVPFHAIDELGVEEDPTIS